jgi:hypothetical protein
LKLTDPCPAVGSSADEASDKDKTYKPRRRAVSEESIGSVHLGSDGAEVMSDVAPVTYKASHSGTSSSVHS